MGATQTRVEAALAQHAPSNDCIPARLHEAMRYATLGGGKRIRPLLTFAAGELTGAKQTTLDTVACAVEMIHTYSLVHDDLPCMDDDVLRRGRPTCHIEFDEPTALLVGDSLQTLAFELLASQTQSNPANQLEMIALLAHASGSPACSFRSSTIYSTVLRVRPPLAKPPAKMKQRINLLMSACLDWMLRASTLTNCAVKHSQPSLFLVSAPHG